MPDLPTFTNGGGLLLFLLAVVLVALGACILADTRENR